MTIWERPFTWEFDIHNEKVKVYESYQIDEVGNLVQRKGGIIPKACQNCKQEFIAPIVDVGKVSKVPWYDCQDCKYNTPSGDGALEHIWMSKHKMKKTIKDHVASVDHKITGDLIAQVKLTKDDFGEPLDVEILCKRCVNNG